MLYFELTYYHNSSLPFLLKLSLKRPSALFNLCSLSLKLKKLNALRWLLIKRRGNIFIITQKDWWFSLLSELFKLKCEMKIVSYNYNMALFLYLTRFCFSSSEKFLYLSQTYCHFFSFSLLYLLWTLSVVFLCYLNNIKLIIFFGIFIYKKKKINLLEDWKMS